jgi:Flp pilus assembly protein TadG
MQKLLTWLKAPHRVSRDALRIGRLTFQANESGSVLIETALSYFLIMTCMLGIIECCLMTYTYSVYADAARHGARYASMHGSASANCSGPSSGCADATAANVVASVTGYASSYAAPVTGMTVVVTYPDTGGCAAPSRVVVTITYNYNPLFTFPGSTHTFQVSSQGRIIY